MLRLVIKMASICLKMIIIAMFGLFSNSYKVKFLYFLRDDLFEMLELISFELGKSSPF